MELLKSKRSKALSSLCKSSTLHTLLDHSSLPTNHLWPLRWPPSYCEHACEWVSELSFASVAALKLSPNKLFIEIFKSFQKKKTFQNHFLQKNQFSFFPQRYCLLQTTCRLSLLTWAEPKQRSMKERFQGYTQREWVEKKSTQMNI